MFHQGYIYTYTSILEKIPPPPPWGKYQRMSFEGKNMKTGRKKRENVKRRKRKKIIGSKRVK
jgi:hypothetical protein